MNDFLEDCKTYAEKHRGMNRKTGPHWPLIIRFVRLFDYAVFLAVQNRKLIMDVETLRRQVRADQ